ncbi:protein of unknown function [Hyphomicrobium sp. 1Nfss2.1]|uniref:hypothetical protein n=1 Tax=Hyphomicrobium sp. 1Nfss2.1 TaxID=3413936 RepID=UPI003C7D7053
MKVASAFEGKNPDELKAELAGGKLVFYSVARPVSADAPVERSEVLATFTFATPAFAASASPQFESNPVKASAVGTPGFARAFKADGTTVADFSVGPGKAEITLSEISTVADFPIEVKSIALPA